MTPHPHKPRVAQVVHWIAWGLCTAGVLALFARPTTTPVVEDEIYWIGSAYYYDLAFRQHDLRSPDWDLLPARENPPIARYLIGASLAMAGQHVTSLNLLGGFYVMFESVPHAWGEGVDQAKRAQVVARLHPDVYRQLRQGGQIHLSEQYLLPARRAMIVCAALTSLLLFLLGAINGHALAGLIASQLWLLHPAVVRSYNHAEADAVASFLSVAAALTGFMLLRRLLDVDAVPTKRTLLLAIGTGVVLALACGAKMNSLVVAFLFVAAALALAAHAIRNRATANLAWLAVTAATVMLSALAVFACSNPAITHDFSTGMIATVREHQLTELIQARFLPDHLVALGEKFSAVVSLAYFGYLGLGLCLAAVVALALLAPRDRLARFITAWWLIAFVAVALWIPFPRTRYVLPLVLPSVAVVALAVGLVFQRVTTRTSDRASPSIGVS